MVRTRIAHAVWEAGRKCALASLLSDIVPDVHLGWCVHRSREPEHSSTWAMRMWRAALDDDVAHTAFLNDDVRVCPRWQETLDAMTSAVPDQVISLHTMKPPMAASWVRSYWLTGPGYIVPKALLPDMIEFVSARWEEYPKANEDNLIMIWAWARQRPIWHAVPALVKHDASVPSLLGHDANICRTTNVAWDTMPTVDTTSVEYWRPKASPPFVECPWMPCARLRNTHALLNERAA